MPYDAGRLVDVSGWQVAPYRQDVGGTFLPLSPYNPTETAIRADPALTDAEEEVLLDLYRCFANGAVHLFSPAAALQHRRSGQVRPGRHTATSAPNHRPGATTLIVETVP